MSRHSQHHPGPAKSDNSDALKAAGDFIRLSTSLATGVLVFSIGFMSDLASFTGLARDFLELAWGLLLISVGAGVLSQAAIPALLAEGNFDLSSKNYSYPGRVHQVLLLVAIFSVATALGFKISDTPIDRPKIDNALDAVSAARATLKPADKVCKIDEIGLVDGYGSAMKKVWHVRFAVAPCSAGSPKYADLLLDPVTGKNLRASSFP